MSKCHKKMSTKRWQSSQDGHLSDIIYVPYLIVMMCVFYILIKISAIIK